MTYGYVSDLRTVSGSNIYFIRDCLGSIKIGVAKDVLRRKRELQTANPNELEVFCVWHVNDDFSAYEIEKYLHERFADCRKCGEWFEENAVIGYLRHGTLKVPTAKHYYSFENCDW